MSKRALGVCYYPEHWPEEWWPQDAARMKALGIAYVRIGEFAWSRLEPKRGDYQFDWLERAMNVLHAAGLKIILGTPTATPPKWLVDEMPDMLPVDAFGRVRGFGSRRHYCFSHEGYKAECARIVTELAKRFGDHPGLVAWQTDNEYECHNTTVSYSKAARDAFRKWLAEKYQSVGQNLNNRWGNIFWSMEYGSFDEIELPNLAVTETNPAHRMDFRRFASDQVAVFNKLQVDILRKFSPGRDIIHNFMGRTPAFDHYKLGADLDVSSWDSYPLGFLEDRSDQGVEWKKRFARAGDPDFQAFHHDLYRATSRGRWWIMEQQPGPVNWAPHNPAPRDGMVRVWTWEAFAHGAEVVTYFRWRQAPFAQEQMHAGLLRPDSVEAPGFFEAQQVAKEIDSLDLPMPDKADIAIVFDFESAWAWEIQPQGTEFDYFRIVFDFYRKARQLGLSVDILPPSTRDFNDYRLVLIPALFAFSDELREAIHAHKHVTLIGPRSGSKTEDFRIPRALPPDLGGRLSGLKVTRVESLRADCPVTVEGGAFKFWREFLETGESFHVLRRAEDGNPALVASGSTHYLAGWPDDTLMEMLLTELAHKAGLSIQKMPDGVRFRRMGPYTLVINYDSEACDLAKLGFKGEPVIGSLHLAPASVTLLKTE